MKTDKVQSIIKKWNGDPNYAIEMLQDIQSEFRYIPKEVIEEISESTGIPRTQLYYLATFYKAFSLKPRGEHEIQVCTGTTCYVKGAFRILESLQRKCGLSDGETTDDLQYTLKYVRCLGCCSLAPVISLDDAIIGKAKSSTIEGLLARKVGEVDTK
ncbi:MAG: NAD(P)H-dependent oxidoreductase subunit E [Thermoplasmata archaeon]|nr:MAG: NAD(P)H-dependent oxidoreductase subunit E [Thermoplasmata archaeon]